jgi:hypothetical protein
MQQQAQPPSQQQGAGGAAGELKSDAKQIGSKAAERLHSEVDARKGEAATQAKSVSSAIQNAAGQLDGSAPAWLRSAFEQGAEQIRRFATTLEQKDSRQIFDEVQTFARQRPALFLGACAAAGFVATRIFKAGGEQQASQQYGSTEWDQSQPWGSVESDFGNSSSTGSFGQQSHQGRESRPFIALGDRDDLRAGQRSASEASNANRDPLNLGTGSSALPSERDDR